MRAVPITELVPLTIFVAAIVALETSLILFTLEQVNEHKDGTDPPHNGKNTAHRASALVTKGADQLPPNHSCCKGGEKSYPRTDRLSRTIGILTLAIVAVTAWIYDRQLDEMRLERRAWIAPITAVHDALKLDAPVAIRIAYGNTGREPALNVKAQGIVGFVTPDRTLESIWTEIGAEIQGCREVDADAGGQPLGAIYPTSAISTVYQFRTHSIVFPRQEHIDGIWPMLVYGCFAYTTLGERHYSSYCLATNSDKTWGFCPVGNDAN